MLTDKVYDVFAYWDGAAVKLEALVWTNTTGRATALTLTEGMYVKATDPTRLYLGTCLAFLGSNIKDKPEERGLWNFFNRVPKSLLVVDGSINWTYNVPSTWRSPNGTDKMVRCVIGLAGETPWFQVIVAAKADASLYAQVGIGDNHNDANDADLVASTGNTGNRFTISAVLNHELAIGSHAIYWIESTIGSGTVTFYGIAATALSQSGLTGRVNLLNFQR